MATLIRHVLHTSGPLFNTMANIHRIYAHSAFTLYPCQPRQPASQPANQPARHPASASRPTAGQPEAGRQPASKPGQEADRQTLAVPIPEMTRSNRQTFVPGYPTSRAPVNFQKRVVPPHARGNVKTIARQMTPVALAMSLRSITLQACLTRMT